jgi:hypothetical protein
MHLMQQIFRKDCTPIGKPNILFSYPPELLYPSVLPIDLGYKSGYMVLWISGFTGHLMGQYFNQSGEYMSDQITLKNVSENYQLSKTGPNYFGIFNFSGNEIFNEYEVTPFHSINKVATIDLDQMKNGTIYASNGAKILENIVVVVGHAKNDDDFDIYGRIIEY